MASSPMEFWGIEVKPGQSIKSDPGADYVIHLSQASLGESKNKAESVPLFVNIDGKKLGLGALSSQLVPQLCFDLVFEKEFELSHSWKNGSVFFLGYKSFTGEVGDDFGHMCSDDECESSDEEEELPVVAAENGKAKENAKPAKAKAGKPDAVKPAVKIAEPSEDDDSDDDDFEDEDDSDDDDDSDESMVDSSDEEDEDEDEETPKKESPKTKKVESSKKRPAEAATPASTKKAKAAVSPQKTDGKKSGHAATPHPAKGGKSSAKTPKSGGQFSCSPCKKSFGSETGLDSHKKAKHGGK